MADAETKDSGLKPPGPKPSLFSLVFSQSYMTPEVIDHAYPGSGTNDDPYVVDWLPNDPRNPYNLPAGTKWSITLIMAFGTLAVSLSSTAFAGALPQVQLDFDVSSELAIASVSLFVLGFAVGPMTWAPISETYGRQILYAAMFFLVTLFGAAAAASPNIQTLLVLRFLAGAFGASSVANSAAVIADIFVAKERGLAMMLYSSAPFLGPTVGPICGGFLAQYAGWKWVEGFTAIFTGVMWILGVLFVPETYTPYLLSRRARKLSRLTGKTYKSKLEAGKPEKTLREVLLTAITRPWTILFLEPIVFVISIYSAIVYGILYLIFIAFPIVFQGERHWSQGVAGLAYIGVMVGQVLAMVFYLVLEGRYRNKAARDPSKETPEGRLEPAMIGGVLLPVGLFWFGWTTLESVHWAVSVVGSSLFGFGQVLLFISLINYVVDAYSVFAASALAASAILRASFAAAFPLFTARMYQNLGTQWASSIPAFLALACAPMPFLFFRWGKALRERSKLATESREILAHMLGKQSARQTSESDLVEAVVDQDREQAKHADAV